MVGRSHAHTQNGYAGEGIVVLYVVLNPFLLNKIC